MLFVIFCDKCKKRFGVIDHTINDTITCFSRDIKCKNCQNRISIYYNLQEIGAVSDVYGIRKLNNIFPKGPHLIYYDKILERLIHDIDYGFSWVHIIENYSDRLKIFSLI